MASTSTTVDVAEETKDSFLPLLNADGSLNKLLKTHQTELSEIEGESEQFLKIDDESEGEFIKRKSSGAILRKTNQTTFGASGRP